MSGPAETASVLVRPPYAWALEAHLTTLLRGEVDVDVQPFYPLPGGQLLAYVSDASQVRQIDGAGFAARLVHLNRRGGFRQRFPFTDERCRDTQ